MKKPERVNRKWIKREPGSIEKIWNNNRIVFVVVFFTGSLILHVVPYQEEFVYKNKKESR